MKYEDLIDFLLDEFHGDKEAALDALADDEFVNSLGLTQDDADELVEQAYVVLSDMVKSQSAQIKEAFRIKGQAYTALNEMTNTRLLTKHLEDGFAVLTAFRVNDYEIVDGKYINKTNPRSLEQNRKDNEELRSELNRHHLNWIPVVGGYIEDGVEISEDAAIEIGLEESTLVFMYDFEEKRKLEGVEIDEFCDFIMKLGYKYNQDSVLIKKPDEKVGQYYITSPDETLDDVRFQKAQDISFSKMDYASIFDRYFTCIAKDIDAYLNKRKQSSAWNKKNPDKQKRNVGIVYKESETKRRLVFVEAFIPCPSGNINTAHIRALKGEFPIFGKMYGALNR